MSEGNYSDNFFMVACALDGIAHEEGPHTFLQSEMQINNNMRYIRYQAQHRSRQLNHFVCISGRLATSNSSFHKLPWFAFGNFIN
ncbi:hypothetical protein DUNSADRAFT_7400 [Dunaliella salina]|uniref:Uncharacterized protein n=1 Tax=Dunaliella salina TaxID=3046 RepID=A0ABQ7H6F4_DUNSA|nr:hypothetical protein DUNSADRAFT_7400 [Dunaliella salina]|eukprot:KAF5842416.1 hypothetical protein DUNSADRAFT_7400 [Dunaliella salina]